MVIDWRKRRPTVPQKIEEDPADQSDNEQENNLTISRDAAQATTGVTQYMSENTAGAISYLDLTEDNYDKAITILNGKCNKPGSAKADHYIAITELPRVDRVEDY
ncbi:hypothetical protein OUZ56_005766 [Daphnia magna]|uniref:Uncharacterized protein n=1 Tax=Daphnia magna TaxID=35525 RepID=A0ABQ9YUC7_9CRUS|nr:hypothetical protein OUZ56_005766 [Daphnia magna]